MTEVNYTVEMEDELRNLEPVNWHDAKAFGEKHGKSTRSVIAKVLQMQLMYIRKPVPTKKPHKITKAELVAEIVNRLGIENKLDGLDKATAESLTSLLEAI